MMTERQRKFREQYRAAISRYYSGCVHIGVMYSAGIAAIWYASASCRAPAGSGYCSFRCRSAATSPSGACTSTSCIA